jgi:hypothetical protein
LRRNDRGLPAVRTPRDTRPEDSTVQPLRADALTYFRVLSKMCPLERWAVIAHRAVTAAERGDARAREWLSTFLLGKPDQLIEEISAACALALIRQVVAVVGDVAERSIPDEHERRAFKREAQRALGKLVPDGVLGEFETKVESGPPQFIMDLARDLGPDVADKLFKGFLAYIILTLRTERGEDLPLRGGLADDLREAMDAFASAADEEDPAETVADDQTP